MEFFKTETKGDYRSDNGQYPILQTDNLHQKCQLTRVDCSIEPGQQRAVVFDINPKHDNVFYLHQKKQLDGNSEQVCRRETGRRVFLILTRDTRNWMKILEFDCWKTDNFSVNVFRQYSVKRSVLFHPFNYLID